MGEASEAGELRWDGASEQIRGEVPEKGDNGKVNT